MAISPIPNSVNKKRVQAGTEVVRGTAVAPTFELYGDMVINKTTPLQDEPEYDGTWDGPGVPTYGVPTLDGSYAQGLTYYDLSILPRYAVKGGVAGVTDAQPTPSYLYTYKPSATVDDLNSMTALTGFDGIIYQSTGMLFDEFTIRGNADDAADRWMWDSRLFVRDKVLQLGLPTAVALTTVTTSGAPLVHVLTPAGGGLIASGLVGQYLEVMSGPGASQVGLITANTATTITVDRVFSPAPTTASTIEVSGEFVAAIAAPLNRDRITFGGTELYIDDAGGVMGTTRIVGRFKAFSVTQALNLNPKRLADDIGAYSAKLDRGRRVVTAQITMEYDDWREVRRWEGKATRLVRISQPNGPQIQASPLTRQTAQINCYNLYWEAVRETVNNNNIIVTYEGRAYSDTVQAASWDIIVRNRLAVLP